MDHRIKLKLALAKHQILKAPGVYDGLSTRLVEQAGFDLGFVSGAGIAFSQFGVPDIGLVSMSELAKPIQTIREISSLPLIVDIDTGFGNAINTQRTVKVLERAGASAMQMEDQVMPKRCGHMKGKQVVKASEMVGKISAFIDARENNDTLLIARTDALAVNGFDDAMERAYQYLAAGADMLFIEAPKTLEQMKIIGDEFGDKVPLIHNLVEGGNSPVSSANDLVDLHYKIALYPVALLHAFVPKAQALLDHIQTTGDTATFPQTMINLNDINNILGAEGMLEKGREFGSEG